MKVERRAALTPRLLLLSLFAVVAALPACHRKVEPTQKEALTADRETPKTPDETAARDDANWYFDVQCRTDQAWNSIGTATIVRRSATGGIAITAAHVVSQFADCQAVELRSGANGANGASCTLKVTDPPKTQGPPKIYPLDIASLRFDNPEHCPLVTGFFRLNTIARRISIPKRDGKLLEFSNDDDAVAVANPTGGVAETLISLSNKAAVLGARYSGSPVYLENRTVVGLVTDRVPLPIAHGTPDREASMRDRDPFLSRYLLVERPRDFLSIPKRARESLKDMVPPTVGAVRLRNDVDNCLNLDTVAARFQNLDVFDQMFIADTAGNSPQRCPGRDGQSRSVDFTLSGFSFPQLEASGLPDVGGDRSCKGRDTDYGKQMSAALYNYALSQLFSGNERAPHLLAQALEDRANCQAQYGEAPAPILQNLRLLLVYDNEPGAVTAEDVSTYEAIMRSSLVVRRNYPTAAAAFRLIELCYLLKNCNATIKDLSQSAGVLQDPHFVTTAPITSNAVPDHDTQTQPFVAWLCSNLIEIRDPDKGSGDWSAIIEEPPSIDLMLSSIERLALNSFDRRSPDDYKKACAIAH